MIYIIDDDKIMAECVARVAKKLGRETRIFSNGIEAMAEIERELPELLFLDILLDGPDGFTFLNELVSYSDTEKIPVVIVTGLTLFNTSFSDYGVVRVLDKNKMRPEEIEEAIIKYGR